jgi:hypothetical protein
MCKRAIAESRKELGKERSSNRICRGALYGVLLVAEHE